jgi:hypothetical protein
LPFNVHYLDVVFAAEQDIHALRPVPTLSATFGHTAPNKNGNPKAAVYDTMNAIHPHPVAEFRQADNTRLA